MTSYLLGQVVSGLVGALVGVLIMAVADQFSFSRNLWPVPICQDCGRRRGPLDCVPIIGPIRARGRCPACDGVGNWRLAVAVELLCVYLAILLYRQFGGLLLACAAVETTVLLAVAVVDFQHRLIPTLLVYPTIIFALATSPAWPNLGLWNSLLGAAGAFGLFFALALFARFTFGEGALGDGDVTLAALMGAICGYPMVVLALALGALCGGVGAIVLLALRRSPLGTAIPYGPYLAAGMIYVLVTGNTLHPLWSGLAL